MKTRGRSPLAWGLGIFLLGCQAAPNDIQMSETVTATDDAGIPCIGADPADQTIYQEKRVFLESQGWWGQRREDGTRPRYGDAEHIHVAMCFPLQQTVSGTVPMRVRVLGHNLPVGTKIKRTILHDSQTKFYTIAWNRTITDQDGPNVVIWADAEINTTQTLNGPREFRIRTEALRPDTTELWASSGWCWRVENGGPIDNVGRCARTPHTFGARGWYTCMEYKNADAADWPYPYEGIPAYQDYSLNITARDGSGENTTLSRWLVRLDPNFHDQKTGFGVAATGDPVIDQPITISGSLLTPGLHKLVIISHANEFESGCAQANGELSTVLAIPLLVN